MSTAAAAPPEVLHRLPGRVRVHLPAWGGEGRAGLEVGLAREPGVRAVAASPLTRNVLLQFDPDGTDLDALLRRAGALAAECGSAAPRPAAPSSGGTGAGTRRARIAVPGVERDPELASRLVGVLERRPGVHARLDSLTGRLEVEYPERGVSLADLTADVRAAEPPGAGRPPEHVMDPGPVVQGSVRLAVAGIGLGILGVRALAGARGRRRWAVNAAALLSAVYGTPAVRHRLHRALGRDAAAVALAVPRGVALMMAGGPVALTLAGLDAFLFVASVRDQRRAWKAYEARVAGAPPATRGVALEMGAGDRTPLPARVRDGGGTALGSGGRVIPAAPGRLLPAGAPLQGGRVSAVQQGLRPFPRVPRAVPPPPDLQERYLQAVAPLPAAYALVSTLADPDPSPGHVLTSLLLLNPSAALAGATAAESLASAAVVRAGAVLVGARRERPLRLPHVLVVDGPRPLVSGLELAGAAPLSEEMGEAEVLSLAAGISAACGDPWGGVFSGVAEVRAEEGRFDGRAATARVDGVAHSLSLLPGPALLPAAVRLRHQGEELLRLRRLADGRTLGVVALRPRPAPGAAELARPGRWPGMEVVLLARQDPAACAAFARRLGLPLAEGSAIAVVRRLQRAGKRVAFLSDSADRGAVFEACDLALALALAPGPAAFPARADLLLCDPGAVAEVLDTVAAHDRARRDGVGISVVATLGGAVWGARTHPELRPAALWAEGAAFAAIAAAWLRLHGRGEAAGGALRLADPRPERWGDQEAGQVLHAFGSTARGLTREEAAARRRVEPSAKAQHPFLQALARNIESPLTALVATGAGLTLVTGGRLDGGVMGLTLVANVLVGTWQEYRVARVADSIRHLGSPVARVLRGGEAVTVPAGEVVPGDVLLVAPGDRLAADARVLEAHGLEVDEAALTGESLPVAKAATGRSGRHHVLLEGSGVLVGHGTAVVVAAGGDTRLGATVAAVAAAEETGSPLASRLGQLFRQVLPVTVAGGVIVTVAGLLRGRPPGLQLATGFSTALAALPEALPILAGMGQAAAARRLARHGAQVRRPSAVEALGRVDVACVDKTGTLTQGRLVLRAVATGDREAELPGPLTPRLRRVLLSAALASPHPDAGDAGAHPTDVAVVRGAEAAGLGEALRARREAEVRFDPERAFHAARVAGHIHVKGAPEAVLARCAWCDGPHGRHRLGSEAREGWLARARELAGRGLRVILVAEGDAGTPPDDPRELVALGFLGISDPLRPAVPGAVRRCHEAGIRVVMLTGDHPATARAIAREAGLDGAEGQVLAGAEIARLPDDELDALMERVTVIARATPLDKLRIIDSLRRRGHTIAMTGDGVNDAPALRLADVGVAMGCGGTEVARQAADVVLARDDFTSLVDALVEGRSFWRNLRRALALLLGGNLGELAFLAGSEVLGGGGALTVRQILAINLLTDALPAFAVVVQSPEHRRLAGLDREGTASLGRPLRHEIFRRAVATAGPAFAASLLSRRAGSPVQARSVGFASIVSTQLALTLEAGRAQGSLTPSVLAAAGGSAGILASLLALPPLRAFFQLETPSAAGWMLVAGSTLLAPVVSAALGRVGPDAPERGGEG